MLSQFATDGVEKEEKRKKEKEKEKEKETILKLVYKNGNTGNTWGGGEGGIFTEVVDLECQGGNYALGEGGYPLDFMVTN